MAFNPNSSSDFLLLTGLSALPVIAINPTQEEAEKLGFNFKEEPVYTGIIFKNKIKKKNEAGEEEEEIEKIYNKIVFFHKGKEKAEMADGSIQEVEHSYRKEFLVQPEELIASTGKPQFVDNLGNFSYSNSLDTIKNNEKMNWFQSDKARKAYVGEESLVVFIKAWLNVGFNKECMIDNPKKLFSGDVSELKGLMKITDPTKNKPVQLIGITDSEKDGKTSYFTKVYSRFVANSKSSTPEAGFHKALHEPYGEFKANYQNSFKLKQFKPEIEPAQPDSENNEGKGKEEIADF